MRVLRSLAVLAAFLVLVPAAGAVTSYDIALDGDTARLNVTFELYADDPGVNYWDTSWRIPEGATVLSVSDTQGAITDYTIEDGVLRFRTNEGPTRAREVIDIQARIEGAVTEEFRELDLVRLRLSGFADRRADVPDEVTQVQVSTERDLLAQSHSLGFTAAMEPHGLNLSGTGPVNLHLSISDQGESYEHFRLFGGTDISTTDDLYWVPAAVTGFLPTVNRYPVVVYDAETYEQEVDRWSAGQYRTGGIIFIKQSTLESDHGPAVLLHEVMHGFNEQALRWTTATRSWFDEGTASYVEWLVNGNRTVPQAEIFGESVRINATYTYPPRKTQNDLWDYYRSGSEAMKTWSLFEGNEVDRTFGYAYAELIIRNKVQEDGPGSLRPVYDDLRGLNEQLDDPISDTRTSNDHILSFMGTSFRPCDRSSKALLRRCLNGINGMDPRIPPLGDLGDRVTHVPLEPVDRPDIGGSPLFPGNGTVDEQARDVATGILAILQRLVQNLLALLG